ncbi:MAG: PIG-L deacetylase family protein [Phycisphaerae bacterium]
MDNRTALAFMAHPDDAEFWCAGTLIRLADAGWSVTIATVTAGDCGTMTENRWQIGARRTDEAAGAAAMIGATYQCLDEPDGLVVFDRPALQKAIDLFRRVAPSLVFTQAPHDCMTDHEMTALLARAASFVHSAPNSSTHPRLPQSQIPYLYYCDPVLGMDPYGRRVKPTTLVDITEQMQKKTAMLARHASQREWLRAHHDMDEYVESMKRHAAERGREAGVAAAEAFVQQRGATYPANDLLSELF